MGVQWRQKNKNTLQYSYRMPRTHTTIVAGVDIGTSQIKVVVGERTQQDTYPLIKAVVSVESNGLRRGYIESAPDVARSIERAILLASKQSGYPITRAVIGVHGIGLNSVLGTGHAVITRADSQVTTLDTNRAIQNSEDTLGEQRNQKIIHTIPQKWKLDGKDIPTKILGLSGNKLEVKTLFVTYPEQQIEEFHSIFESLGIDIDDTVASPIAASLCALSKKERTIGSCVIDIGAETTTVIVYEHSVPHVVHTINLGSNDITHDIALGLKVSLEDAEKMKRGTYEGSVSKRKVDEIIRARTTDIFELVDAQLKKIHRSGLLPAGALITGGGSKQKLTLDIAKEILRIPVTTESQELYSVTKNKIKDPGFSVAFGLSILQSDTQTNRVQSTRETITQSMQSIIHFFKQFLP